MNMLSAKKVRMHGMKSSRWTCKDKITQYKGLINLFTRDKKILQGDIIISRKKLNKEIKQIAKDIKVEREELDNAIQGDRQMLRNTLQDNRDLQLAYSNSHPLKVLENLYQDNFNKRKLIDRLRFKMSQKSQELINLKLEKEELEDRAKYDTVDNFPIEVASKIVTGKVQDAILKKEAALSVKYTYQNILKILKKDAIFFDVVLETLKIDGFLQGKCMVRTSELGQLATEYLDDRKQEFEQLAKAVKRDMKIREANLKSVRREVADLNTNMTTLIRKDDDVNTGRVIIPLDASEARLNKDIEDLDEVLTFLQDTFYESSFDRIYPSLMEQTEQTQRLKELLEKIISDRDNLLEKETHAQLMHDQLLYTMNETTFEYKKEKARLIDEQNSQLKRKTGVKELDLLQSNLLVQVRGNLHQLALKCGAIKVRNTAQDLEEERVVRIVGAQGHHSVIVPPEFESDCIKILAILEDKLDMLVKQALPQLSESAENEANKFFYNFVADTSNTISYEDEVDEDALIGGIDFEDSSVPNYQEMKFKSKELVEISTVNEDLVPMFAPKK